MATTKKADKVPDITPPAVADSEIKTPDIPADIDPEFCVSIEEDKCMTRLRSALRTYAEAERDVQKNTALLQTAMSRLNAAKIAQEQALLGLTAAMRRNFADA